MLELSHRVAVVTWRHGALARRDAVLEGAQVIAWEYSGVPAKEGLDVFAVAGASVDSYRPLYCGIGLEDLLPEEPKQVSGGVQARWRKSYCFRMDGHSHGSDSRSY